MTKQILLSLALAAVFFSNSYAAEDASKLDFAKYNIKPACYGKVNTPAEASMRARAEYQKQVTAKSFNGTEKEKLVAELLTKHQINQSCVLQSLPNEPKTATSYALCVKAFDEKSDMFFLGKILDEKCFNSAEKAVKIKGVKKEQCEEMTALNAALEHNRQKNYLASAEKSGEQKNVAEYVKREEDLKAYANLSGYHRTLLKVPACGDFLIKPKINAHNQFAKQKANLNSGATSVLVSKEQQEISESKSLTINGKIKKSLQNAEAKKAE